MIASINGKEVALAAEQEPLTALLARLGYDGGHFAVAVNGAFIAKSRHGEISIQNADRVEVLAPMVGG